VLLRAMTDATSPVVWESAHDSGWGRRRSLRALPHTTLDLVIVLSIGCSSEFQPPTRLKAGGVPVRVESPGYAAPCWADIDGDGKKDLLVGQFSGGMIRVYKNLGEGNLATAQWLMAEGAPAEVPGVW
jgi:hypothetical protein